MGKNNLKKQLPTTLSDNHAKVLCQKLVRSDHIEINPILVGIGSKKILKFISYIKSNFKFSLKIRIGIIIQYLSDEI